MAKAKALLSFALKVALALIILNFILGAVDKFFPSLVLRKYIYTPYLALFPTSATTGP